MLLRFSVENFKSFGDEVMLSLVAGRPKRHTHHVYATPSTAPNILRLGLIYGANASGKSNLCRAIYAARNTILHGSRDNRINVTPNRTDEKFASAPTTFQFDFLEGDQTYWYSFSATHNEIISESLVVTTNDEEIVVFSRSGSQIRVLDSLFENDSNRERVHYMALDTRADRLFLSECADRTIIRDLPELSHLLNAYTWFSERLVCIFPDWKYIPLQAALLDEGFRIEFSRILNAADTGISDILLKEVQGSEDGIGVNEEVEEFRTHLKERRSRDEPQAFLGGSNSDYLAEPDNEGGWTIRRLITQHMSKQRQLIDFKVSEESSGTQRMIDLIPALILGSSQNARTFVIDEIGRSLHPSLTRWFVDSFLHTCDNHRTQLIATTHEDSLLDLNVLRQDEIHFVEKDRYGFSTLANLEEFRVRHDLDIRRGYLQGRFGGIPILDELNWERDRVSSESTY